MLDSIVAKIPKRHVIENFSGVRFGFMYILKWKLNGWEGILFILFFWALAIFFWGYW